MDFKLMKPVILIIVDMPGWALDRTADNIIVRLKNNYTFIKAYNKDAVEAIGKKNYDLLYITYWRQFKDAGISTDIPRPAVAGVRSHFKWDQGKGLQPSQEVIDFLNSFDALNVPSRILYDIFKEKHPAVFHTPHGVDEKVFYPRRERHFTSQQGKLIIGWTGSKKNHPGKRGIDDFIVPAVQSLDGVSLKIAAREDKWRTQEEMVDFYHGLDAYICASRTEGGPHPLLEAAACGIPLISTRVGIAPELIKQYENGILVDRTVDEIRKAIVLMRDNQEMRREMGIRSREIIETGWTWDRQAVKYIPFFDYALKKT
jgi:glycosyltransferase involved in cell wall biosynthesis